MAIKQSNRVVSVLFTDEQLAGLKVAAAVEDRSMSKYVGRIIIDHLLKEGVITEEEAYPAQRTGVGRLNASWPQDS